MFSRWTWSLCALMISWHVGMAATAAGADGKDSAKRAGKASAATQCSVVIVKHIDCELAARHIRCLFEGETELHKATWFAPADAILLRAAPEEVKQMEYLIAKIDVPAEELAATPARAPAPGQVLEIVAVRHAKARELAKLVETMLHRRSRGNKRSSAHVAPRVAIDDRTNVIVLLATEEQLVRARELVSALDVPMAPASESETDG